MSIAKRKSSGAQAETELTAAGVARRRLWQSAAMMLGALTTASRAVAAPCAAADGNGLRQSLHYVESGPDPAKHCSGCAFFSDPQGDCGSCMIFSGPANKNGHCDSWSARS